MTFNEWVEKNYGIGTDDLTDNDYDALYAEYEIKKKNTEAEYLGVLEEPETEERHGWYYHVQKEGGKLMAGYMTNTGFLPHIEIEYDNEIGLDDNLAELYDTIMDYEYEGGF